MEYKGSIPADKREEARTKLEQELTRLIQQGSVVKVQMSPYDKIAELCGSVPDYLPKNQEARIVTLIGDKGCPCGGTHVKDIKEIGAIKIRKLQVKGETTRIGYDVV